LHFVATVVAEQAMDDRNTHDRAPDAAMMSIYRTGSLTVDRELERDQVRAALFDRDAGPRIGRYRLGDRLGDGASSVVYAGHDVELERRVAIKIFVAESSATRRQVQREARALAQLRHHNVVTVYDVGEWRDHSFIAMELITGTTLARWQAVARSTAELLDAYLQAGQGLDAAHRAGLVHRDFKPANVMVADDGRVVVTDFGLVCDIDATSTRTGSARLPVGTPAYVAPEQLRGATPHPSADIYSFALALCEALIGWHPIQQDTRTWQRALARKVRPRLYTAICTGLAEDPAVRGASITPLLAELARRTEHRARVAAMTPWLDELAPATPRRWLPRSAWITAGLLAPLLLTTLGSHTPQARSSEQPPGHSPEPTVLDQAIQELDRDARRVVPCQPMGGRWPGVDAARQRGDHEPDDESIKALRAELARRGLR
jgi:serine/threonine protein kinase